MNRCSGYASDLTDARGVMPVPNRIGRPRKSDLREIINALLCIASTQPPMAHAAEGLRGGARHHRVPLLVG
jgi:uncharacterized protein YukJ